jgi:hypothetical protein
VVHEGQAFYFRGGPIIPLSLQAGSSAIRRLCGLREDAKQAIERQILEAEARGTVTTALRAERLRLHSRVAGARQTASKQKLFVSVDELLSIQMKQTSGRTCAMFIGESVFRLVKCEEN